MLWVMMIQFLTHNLGTQLEINILNQIYSLYSVVQLHHDFK